MDIDNQISSDSDLSASNCNSSLVFCVVGQKRKKSSLVLAPTYTTSHRSNKYAGFKPKNDFNTKTIKSKVKPRKDPTIKPVVHISVPSI
jgi:hypothetical protein